MTTSAVLQPAVAAVLLLLLLGTAAAQCPWRRAVPELNSMCACVLDDLDKLSIQCSDANFPLLMTTIHKTIRNRPVDLLYVNDTDIGILNSRIFEGLYIENIQFSHSRIYNISDEAFTGLEESLKNLNLQGNRLQNVPSAALTNLHSLQLLDISGNHITRVPDGSFGGLRLATLKLGENNLFLSRNAFEGLETSLKNLNLKASGLSSLPMAVLKLDALAFLDLAQNEIRTLPAGAFRNLKSLAALNLERNLLQSLRPDTFFGVNDTLSSLSLLSNHLARYPTQAINSLTQLRVLDIGFNLMEELPLDAFHAIDSLTLLALDGNQLSTVPQEPFRHLASSLKGLSVGGKFLVCDCHVSWIIEWIKKKDLQVTSRERNPQFCGEPAYLRQRSFYQLSPDQLVCNTTSFTVTTSTSVGGGSSPLRVAGAPLGDVGRPGTPSTRPNEIVDSRERPTSFDPNRSRSERTTSKPKITSFRPDQVRRMEDTRQRPNAGGGRQDSSLSQNQDLSRTGSVKPGKSPDSARVEETPKTSLPKKRPQLVRHPDSVEREASAQFGNQASASDEVIIQDAYRKDNSVIIQWVSEVANILGFRVVYRLFGDKQFKLGPPLASSEREFKIRNVPTQECIVVCVVSLEDVNVTPDTVPYPQCREIRTEDSAATHMDTIIIAASAAICGTVILALIIFICCNRRRQSRHLNKDAIPPSVMGQAAPLASLGTLGGGMKPDWDTLSMYSQRSIPRARMYHMDKGNINGGFIPDDVQSLASLHRPLSRAIAENQSLRNYPGMGGVGPQLASLSMSRPDLRMSRQSLAGNQLMGYNGLGPGMMGMGGLGGMGMDMTGLNTINNMGRMGSQGHFSRGPSTRSRHSRSKSRDRASSRMSHAEDSHSLTECDSDGFSDHDVDIYVGGNATRSGLVRL